MQVKSTLKDRAQRTVAIVTDKDLDLSPKEIMQHTYYWVRFEIALMKRERQAQKCRYYAERMNADIDVFNMRINLIDL